MSSYAITSQDWTRDEAPRIVRHDRGYRLTVSQWLPRPIDDVFDFFSDALNLEQLTPDRLQFHILTRSPVVMREGTLIDYRLKLYGFVPIRWSTLISAWEPPYRFVDEALRSPYRYWRHEHCFRAERGGTTIEDTVDYGVPFGALAHRMFVRRDLLAIFGFRNAAVARHFA